MSKAKAVVLGACTLWPIAYMFIFMSVIFSQVFRMEAAVQHSEGIPLVFKIIFPLHFLTMIWITALIVIYIRHIFKSDAIAADKKALWAVVIFLGNMAAMPVYWYLYIWKRVE
jgi:hypothetical protein